MPKKSILFDLPSILTPEEGEKANKDKDGLAVLRLEDELNVVMGFYKKSEFFEHWDLIKRMSKVKASDSWYYIDLFGKRTRLTKNGKPDTFRRRKYIFHPFVGAMRRRRW